MRLAPFDGELAQRVLDAANAIIATIPKDTPPSRCPKCGESGRLFYGTGEGEGHCSVCEWEELGIIPLRPKSLDIAIANNVPLFEAPS